MSEFLSSLQKKKGVESKAKRRGRGYGSGKGGHTIGKGNKGQKARTGGKIPTWYEGGQTPLVKRIPYARGFVNHNARKVISLNISEIQDVIEAKKVVTVNDLIEKGLVGSSLRVQYVKILGRGEIKGAVKFTGFLYSAKAKQKITEAGGTAD